MVRGKCGLLQSSHFQGDWRSGQSPLLTLEPPAHFLYQGLQYAKQAGGLQHCSLLLVPRSQVEGTVGQRLLPTSHSRDSRVRIRQMPGSAIPGACKLNRWQGKDSYPSLILGDSDGQRAGEEQLIAAPPLPSWFMEGVGAASSERSLSLWLYYS